MEFKSECDEPLSIFEKEYSRTILPNENDVMRLFVRITVKRR